MQSSQGPWCLCFHCLWWFLWWRKSVSFFFLYQSNLSNGEKKIAYLLLLQDDWANNLVESSSWCWNHDRWNIWSIATYYHSKKKKIILLSETNKVSIFLIIFNLFLVQLNKIEESIEFINSGPKPLALYAFTKNKTLKERILQETSSGCVTFNDTMIQVNLKHLVYLFIITI